MYVLRQLVFALVFSRRLTRREHINLKRLLILPLLLCMGFVSQWGVNQNLDDFNLPANAFSTIFSTVVFCVLTFICIAIVINSVFEVSVLESVYAATITYLTEHADYCLYGIIEDFLPDSLCNILNLLPVAILRLVLMAVIVDFVIARHILHKNHYIAQYLDTVAMLITSTLIVALMSAIATEMGFVPIHRIYATLIVLIILGFQIERQRTLSQEIELEIERQLLQAQQAQYESYRENIELVNRKCHDLKHQVEAIRQLENSQEKDQALNEIENAVLIYDSFIKSGSKMLDTILTQKNLICMENDILFTCIADGTKLNFMQPVDLYTLFGNLMDNAIEAVIKLPKEQRSISLYVGEDRGLVVINEENPFLEIAESNHKLVTTKQDHINHGFGLKSIEIAVSKYDGIFKAIYSNGKFQASAVIQAK